MSHYIYIYLCTSTQSEVLESFWSPYGGETVGRPRYSNDWEKGGEGERV